MDEEISFLQRNFLLVVNIKVLDVFRKFKKGIFTHCLGVRIMIVLTSNFCKALCRNFSNFFQKLCSIILEAIALGIYLCLKIFFLIDTNAKM